MSGWIPPLPIALGMLAFGFSWLVLFAAARTMALGISFTALAWVHVVALGWITLIALSVLIHVIPTFLDVEWRLARVARGSTLFFAAGAAALVGGFLGSNYAALVSGAALAILAIAVYGISACEPLAEAIRRKGVARAVARAFGTTLAFFVAAATLGLFFALALAGSLSAQILRDLPASHALLGIAGWLSLLVIGVSARTIGPIAGARSGRVWAHIASSSAILAGVLVAAFAQPLAKGFAPLGCGLLLLGILIYADDLWEVLLRATVRHRPPQAFMACATVAAIVAALLSLATATGAPWGAATVYLALLGWIGSAVLAHLHHIGVRVLLTNVRGEEDETRPQEVLTTALTWATLVAFEVAVAAGTVGLLEASGYVVQVAAAAGFVSYLALVCNFALAYRKAREPAGISD